jgi:hypothetical protein
LLLLPPLLPLALGSVLRGHIDQAHLSHLLQQQVQLLEQQQGLPAAAVPRPNPPPAPPLNLTMASMEMGTNTDSHRRGAGGALRALGAAAAGTAVTAGAAGMPGPVLPLRRLMLLPTRHWQASTRHLHPGNTG